MISSSHGFVAEKFVPEVAERVDAQRDANRKAQAAPLLLLERSLDPPH
jgi:hypothetical protein